MKPPTSTVSGTFNVSGTLRGQPIGDTAHVTFGAAPLHHFLVEAAAGGNIPDQLVNTPFNVKVTAQDIYNNTVTTFTGSVNFTTKPVDGITAGAASPAFTAGVLASHAITIGTTGNDTLVATRVGGQLPSSQAYALHEVQGRAQRRERRAGRCQRSW